MYTPKTHTHTHIRRRMFSFILRRNTTLFCFLATAFSNFATATLMIRNAHGIFPGALDVLVLTLGGIACFCVQQCAATAAFTLNLSHHHYDACHEHRLRLIRAISSMFLWHMWSICGMLPIAMLWADDMRIKVNAMMSTIFQLAIWIALLEEYVSLKNARRAL